MSVFEDHTERLADEAMGAAFDALVRRSKLEAEKQNLENAKRWRNSFRHKLARFLNGLSHKVDIPKPEEVDWRKTSWR